MYSDPVSSAIGFNLKPIISNSFHYENVHWGVVFNGNKFEKSKL